MGASLNIYVWVAKRSGFQDRARVRRWPETPSQWLKRPFDWRGLFTLHLFLKEAGFSRAFTGNWSAKLESRRVSEG